MHSADARELLTLAVAASQATLRITGDGLVPFDDLKSETLTAALTSVMPSIVPGGARVLRVSPAVSFRRRLHRDATPLPDVVDVLVELDGSGPNAAAGMQEELRSVISNGMLGVRE